MSRWVVVCAYDGGPFSGWQSQPTGDSIQDAIEQRLAEIFKTAVRIHGSGRTDAGVHALGQVFQFDAEWKHGSDRLRAALAARLPSAIQIKSLKPGKADFHARFSATGKIYTYRIQLGDADPFSRPYVWELHRPLDLAAMRRAAAVLMGTHDFRAFAATNGTEREDTVRTLSRLDLAVKGRSLKITAQSTGFLYKMVRSLVGILVAVGEGSATEADVARLLQAKERKPLVQTAPAKGLFLVKVLYAGGTK